MCMTLTEETICDWSFVLSLIEITHPLFYGSVIALLKFLKLVPAKKGLPHPNRPLYRITPALSIAEVNEEVKMIVTTGGN